MKVYNILILFFMRSLYILMSYIRGFIHNSIIINGTNKFNIKKFMHNNLCILILSVYLSIEQLYYGFYTTEFGSTTKKIFIGTAFIMMIYVVISGLIQANKVKKFSWINKLYEISFSIIGFGITIARSLLFNNNTFALPSLYIAVIYGFAVFFYFSPGVSLLIYCISCNFIVVLMPTFNPDIVSITYVQDIVTNNIIAWIASVINYHRYVKEFEFQETIYYKNEELQAKTESIQKTNRMLQYISNVDELTNIYNRRKLNEFLQIEYDRCELSKNKISVILMDIDFFKSVNDNYGHTIGDKVLKQFGELLKNNIGKNNKVGRWGGEEFLIICPETDFNSAFSLAEKMRRCIEEHDFKLKNNVTCSFGVATSKDRDTITNLIIRADNGLYKAKESGRNNIAQGD